ncbi:MAG: hypothetical protein RL235_347 [Chlamydiota bacterium]|jgi:GTP-binding protein
MLPKIALVGRPNVGKSALFNRIAAKRLSIVDDAEGITRDRLFAHAEIFGRPFIVIDTGGIDPSETLPFAKEVRRQAELAIAEADVVILVVDLEVGLTTFDEEVAKLLKAAGKPVVVAVNKADRALRDEAYIPPFYALGIKHVMGVSAAQGHNIAELVQAAIELLPEPETSDATVPEEAAIRVAIVGRPNVGKSTLFNGLIHEERSIVSPTAGTTRDAIDAIFQVGNTRYQFIDTAGIRRKKAETEVVDKFAAIRTQEAIAKADVCILVLDSFEGFTIQERRIAREIEELGKSCILVFNKWDLIKELRMEHALRAVREEVPFLGHCPALFISATKGRNLDKIFPLILEAHSSRHLRISTGALNQFMERCVQKYHPPLILGKRLRIYYLTQVETNPPRFILFVNNPTLLTETYRKYLINQMRDVFPFTGCPIAFELRGKTKAQLKSLADTHTSST